MISTITHEIPNDATFTHINDAICECIPVLQEGVMTHNSLKCLTKENPPLIWKTYRQWEDNGHQVKRGSRATWFDGVPMFSDKQVKDADDSDYHPGAAYASCPQDWD